MSTDRKSDQLKKIIKVGNFEAEQDSDQTSMNPIFEIIFQNNTIKLREYLKAVEQTKQVSKLVN